MQLHVYDQANKLVVCMQGALNINHGKHGEVIRVLENCANHPWRHFENGTEQCHAYILANGLCQNAAMREHILLHCKRSCGWCGAADHPCEDHVWAMSGEDQCNAAGHGNCSSDHMKMYCPKYCGYCHEGGDGHESGEGHDGGKDHEVKEADDAYHSRIQWILMGSILVIMYKFF